MKIILDEVKKEGVLIKNDGTEISRYSYKGALDKNFTLDELKEEIERYASANHIDVRLTGFLNQDQVTDYLALADWFLLPSLSDPNPLSVIEAMWAGLPLACSKYVGNNPETLTDGVNGFLFDTLDKGEMEETLKKIKEADEDWLKKAGEASLEVATPTLARLKCL